MSFNSPSHIFVGREKQKESFLSLLSTWCSSLDQPTRIALSTIYPDSSSAIQGLLVFIYGHDGMGKSTLLARYRQAVLEQNVVSISRIITWQNPQSLTPSRELPGADQHSIVREFFAIVAGKIAVALNKKVYELKEYQQASQALNSFCNQLVKVSSDLLLERQYNLPIASSAQSPRASKSRNESSRNQMLESIKAFLTNDSPIPSSLQLEMKGLLRSVALKEKQNTHIWNPEKLLGEALGCDLATHAADHPLLLFFDSYDPSREADASMRVIMQAAGERVGWVVASRKDLWSSNDYIWSSEAKSYQEFVVSGRGLFINLQDQESGFFSASTIQSYFQELRVLDPFLPDIDAKGIAHIAAITQGIPLGVRIIAELYKKNSEVFLKLSEAQTPVVVVDQLMQYYLANPEQKEKLQLCAFALLRRTELAELFFVSAGLIDQVSNMIEAKVQLSKYADFVSDGYEAGLSLHSVVCHIIRQWILKHRREVEISSLLQQLHAFYKKALQKSEERAIGTTLYDLFANAQWVEASLDLIEILLWIDGESALKSAFFFLIASSIYNGDATQKLLEIVVFFELYLPVQPFQAWQDALFVFSLAPNDPFPDQQKVRRLTGMIEDIKRLPSDAGPLLFHHRQELIALLAWKIADITSLFNPSLAEKYYLEAWSFLHTNPMLQKHVMQFFLHRAYELFDQRRYVQCEALLEQACDIQYNHADVYYTLGNIYFARASGASPGEDHVNDSRSRLYARSITSYQYAIVIEPDHTYAYMNLGDAHYICGDYQRAFDEYMRVEELKPACLPPSFYYNRANIYSGLDLFHKAREDYDKAIELESDFSWAFGNRGYTHAMLGNYHAALADYRQAATLAPRDCNVVWTATWAQFTTHPLQEEDWVVLQKIVADHPQHYIAYICRALIEGLQNSNWLAALSSIKEAVRIEPNEGDTHFWKGIIAAYLGEVADAKEEIEKAVSLKLPPIFFSPLYWLQDRNPEFFIACATLL